MANRFFNQFTWALEKNPVVLFAKVDQGDTSTVVTTADTAGSLASTFFRIKGFVTGKTYMFWFKVSGTGTNPATASDTAIEVDITTGDTNVTVATAIRTAMLANLYFLQDFTVAALSGHTVTVTSKAGGCANAHDGLSAFATHFTFTNTVYPVLDTANSWGIETVTRSSAGIYVVTFGTPAPTSTYDIYNRLLLAEYTPLTSAAPAAPLMFVTSETVSSNGVVNLKFVAASDGSTATDPACGETMLLQFFLKNTTAQ